MNEKLTQDLFHLNSKLENDKKASSADNAFLFFKIEYENYFLPLYERIIPEIEEYLSFAKKDNKENYYKHIDIKWIPLLEQKIKRKRLNNLANIHICEYLIKGINSYIINNEFKNSTTEKQKQLLRFLKRKNEIIVKVMREDFELGIKTISAIKSPYIQFHLIQYNEHIKRICQSNFLSMSEYEVYYYLSQYFCYPRKLDIDEYFQRWKGYDKIHIKFCREILKEKYKTSKSFLKGSNNE